MRSILTLLALSGLGFHSASAAVKPVEAYLNFKLRENPQAEQELLSDLKAEINRRVRFFKRPIKVYHYGTRGAKGHLRLGKTASSSSSNLALNHDEAIDLKRSAKPGGEATYHGPVELHPQEAFDYFGALTDIFYTGVSSWNVGPGLYAAIDPVQSESYAGNPWFLLEISIPEGIKYIDLRPADGFIFSKKFIQKWFIQNPENFFQHVDLVQFGEEVFHIDFTSLLGIEAFKKVIVQAFKELKVDVMAYAWAGHTVLPCAERTLRQRIAFDFINPDFLKRIPNEALSVYVQTLESDASMEKKQAYEKLLQKIEASLIGDTLYLDPAAATKVIPPVLSWDSMKWHARILTLGWNQALGRTSFLEGNVFEKNTIQQLIGIFSALDTDAHGDPIPADANPTTANALQTPFLTTQFKAILSKDKSLMFLDPLALLKKQDPDRYQKLIQWVEEDTFGCSPRPEFAEENQAPALIAPVTQPSVVDQKIPAEAPKIEALKTETPKKPQGKRKKRQ